MTTTTTRLHKADCPQSGGTPGLIGAGGSSQPLINRAVLERLREDLDEYEVWRVFVQNFINALPLRIEKLRAALTTGDAVGARDAVLSLKTASQMVGAERLAALTLDLEAAQREALRIANPGRALPPLAVDYLYRIKQRAGQTSDALQTHLDAARRPRKIIS
jgi:HPt (histidine-containing phosphotransfer) domain-containing protein